MDSEGTESQKTGILHGVHSTGTYPNEALHSLTEVIAHFINQIVNYIQAPAKRLIKP